MEEQNAEKEKIRNGKSTIMLEFRKLKNSQKINLNNIKELMDHCNTIQEIIYFYLNLLKEFNDSQYISEKIFYYKIISPELSKQHGIDKISEKERFYQIINKFLNDVKFKDYARDEILKCSKELISFYEIEEKKINEPDLEKKKKKISELNLEFSRWDTIYNSKISFKDIYNEEFFFYSLSNSFLRDYIQGQFSLPKRKTAVAYFIDLFKLVEPNKQKYPEYFEFISYALLNGEMRKNKNDELLFRIGTSIENELSNEFFSIKDIEVCLQKIKVPYIISGNEITINHKNYRYFIDNYNNYNLNNNIINGLLGENNITYQVYLQSKQKFKSYINTNYFDGLLNKIILNYSKSNLAKDSIKKLFNINENEYKQLFEEVTTEKIINYIYYLPYNNAFDTARTIKVFSKIFIDPIKDLFNNDISKIFLSEKLLEGLKKFVNIVQRKYKFEHEQHHLVTILLFFLYINNRRRINSLPKEINQNKVETLSEEEFLDKKTNQNVVKEAGHSFELFTYGKIHYGFFLKDLLFIANEENDNLKCEEYRNRYEKCGSKSVEEILKEFPTNQVLSDIIVEIKDGIEEEKSLKKNCSERIEEIFANNLITRIDDNKESISIEDLENMKITVDDYAYNNHIIEKKYYYDYYDFN